jgi:DNA polymerase-3 subunit epsilon
VPTAGPVAVVWNSYDWIRLYDVKDTRPKRKPTEKQLGALAEGRERLEKMLTCTECGFRFFKKEDVVEGVCAYCNERTAELERIKVIREEAKEVFLSWLDEDFLILDTKTTGLQGEIVEIAIIDRQRNVLFDSLIKPTVPIPEEVIAIHGITNEAVKNAPNWFDVWDTVRMVLQGKKILIYNADFDEQMIFHSCAAHGIPFTPLGSECVMKTYADYVGSDRWLKLSDASGECTQHRALDDCFSVLSLLQRVFQEISEGHRILSGEEASI